MFSSIILQRYRNEDGFWPFPGGFAYSFRCVVRRHPGGQHGGTHGTGAVESYIGIYRLRLGDTGPFYVPSF